MDTNSRGSDNSSLRAVWREIEARLPTKRLGHLPRDEIFGVFAQNEAHLAHIVLNNMESIERKIEELKELYNQQILLLQFIRAERERAPGSIKGVYIVETRVFSEFIARLVGAAEAEAASELEQARAWHERQYRGPLQDAWARERQAAWTMALHPRLGAGSGLGTMPADVLGLIQAHVRQQPQPPPHHPAAAAAAAAALRKGADRDIADMGATAVGDAGAGDDELPLEAARRWWRWQWW